MEYTVQHKVHNTVQTVQFTIKTTCTVQNTELYAIHNTVQTVQYTIQYNLYSTKYTIQYKLYGILYTQYSAKCTVKIHVVRSNLYIVLFSCHLYVFQEKTIS